MTLSKTILSYIPRSKSIIKDCTILELISGETRLRDYLVENKDSLSDDEEACYLTLMGRNADFIPVKNFRSLKIALIELYEKLGITKYFLEEQQLSCRKLDPNSSQWSTAKILMGEDNGDKRYHCELAREVKNRYELGERESLFETKDDNYIRLFDYFINNIPFNVDNSELAVFAVCLGVMNLEEAIKLFPTWKHHEEDRTIAIKKALDELTHQKIITSNDHRIVIGIKLRSHWLGMNPVFENPQCVSKSFPKFWLLMKILMM